jgi:hypothetical protein
MNLLSDEENDEEDEVPMRESMNVNDYSSHSSVQI